MTIADLTADQLVATDAGTHAMPETTEVFERVNGTRYGVRTACGVRSLTQEWESVHGRMRWLTVASAAARRAQIELLKAAAKAATAKAVTLESRRADLLRGWDGYQFVGMERGRELAAQL